MTEPDFQSALTRFRDEFHINEKGALSVVLQLTDFAKERHFPLNSDDLKTDKQGQVKGLSGPKVQRILARHGISRMLASEGGRTSRGSMRIMLEYVALLNHLNQQLDINCKLDSVEAFWIAEVKRFFDAMPFELKLDASLSFAAAIDALLEQAKTRQKQSKGTMYLGIMVQHLVGAKLTRILGVGQVKHHNSSTKDEGKSRNGDFDLADVSVHVSTAPNEQLIDKCSCNLASGVRPIIVSTETGLTWARDLASQLDLDGRIEFLEIKQFLATNFHEWSGFERQRSKDSIQDFVDGYNDIIEANETDPSLKIRLS